MIVVGHWIVHILGIDTQQSWAYDFWSGIGPCLISLVALGLTSLTVYLVFNCHQFGCKRVGRYPVAGGQYRTCRKHHPDPAVQGGLRAHSIRLADRQHRERE